MTVCAPDALQKSFIVKGYSYLAKYNKAIQIAFLEQHKERPYRQSPIGSYYIEYTVVV